MNGSSSQPFIVLSDSSDDDSSPFHGHQAKREVGSSSNHPQHSSFLLDPSLAISNNIKYRNCILGEREVLQGGRLCLESIRGMPLLRNQHVLDFISKDLPIQSDMVEWFYRNVTIKIDLRKVEGKKIVFQVAFPHTNLCYNDINLENEFGLVCDGERCASFTVWPSDKGIENNGEGDEWLTACYLNKDNQKISCHDTTANLLFMKGKDFVVEHILRKCLLPSPNSSNECSRQSTLLLFMIKKNRLVNWPYVISQHMKECGNNRRIAYLPYGGLITHILKSWNLNFPSNTLPCSTLLDSCYFHQWDIFRAKTKFVKFDERASLNNEEREAFDQETATFGLRRGIEYIYDDNELSEEPIETFPVSSSSSDSE